MIVRSVIRFAFSKIVVPAEGKLQINKKKDSDITQLRKQLQIQKQNRLSNPDAIYDEIPHRAVYQKINTSIEAFFNKRSFNIQNFNFLLNVIAQQKKTEEIKKVLELMYSMNILPTEETYNYIIRAWAQKGDVQKTEEAFDQYKKLFMPTKHAYNSLMIVYKNYGLCQKAELLFEQMKREGIEPDLPIFTTLINANHKSRNINRCWQLHKQLMKNNIRMDQPYIGMMMTVYSSSHDAEKAIKLYEEHIKDSEQTPYIETLNAYLRALASRSDYSERAINYFFLLISRGQFINKSTITSALKACANLGHIKDATSIIKVMREKGIEPDQYVYNSMFRCYAGAVSLPNMSEQTVQLFITDAWKLLEEVNRKRLINVTVLNSFMLIFIQALRSQEIEGLVLPLYKKYGIRQNQYTYQSLMRFLKKKDDIVGMEKMWDSELKYVEQQKQEYLKKNNNNQMKLNSAMKRGLFYPTFDSICMHLDAGIKLMDMNKIIESLRLLKKMNRHPKFFHLKFLGELKDLPIQIKAELTKFQTQFGDLVRTKGKPWEHKRKQYLDPQDR